MKYSKKGMTQGVYLSTELTFYTAFPSSSTVSDSLLQMYLWMLQAAMPGKQKWKSLQQEHQLEKGMSVPTLKQNKQQKCIELGKKQSVV